MCDDTRVKELVKELKELKLNGESAIRSLSGYDSYEGVTDFTYDAVDTITNLLKRYDND